MLILNESIYISVWCECQVRGEMYPISVFKDVAQVDDSSDNFIEPPEYKGYVLIYFDQFTEII